MPSCAISSSRMPDEIGILAEDDPPGAGLVLPADDVEQCRLACAVRTDHHAEFAIVDDEVQIVQGLEAIIIDDDAFQVNDGAVSPS